jgi:hypothetical protein
MGLDELSSLPSTEELLEPSERRGEEIQKTTEFENLGIEDGGAFHEQLQAAGMKLSKMALDLMPIKKSEERMALGAEIIDNSVPLVLLATLSSRHLNRIDFELIRPPSDALDKINDPEYLFTNCSLKAKNPQGDLISEMGFAKDFETNIWYQEHRRTNTKFSRQIDATGVPIRMGREMLAAGEKAPEIMSKMDRDVQTVRLDVSQVGVMRWALQNGYKLATPEDERLWQRVQSGDGAFYVKDYIEPEEEKPDFLYWKNPKEKDPNWDKPYDPMVRIKFVKKFVPEGKESWEVVDDAVEGVRKNIGDVPGVEL